MELRDDLVSGHQSSDHTYRENVVLAGITGAGKSTAGKQLALLLGMGFIDLDAMVERMTGKSINAIFESGSENEFREAERQALESVTNIKSHVIALGGGALQDKSCLDMVRKIGVLIWLKPTPDEVARRMFMRVQELEKRPMFRDLVSIEQKDERRAAIRDRIAATLSDRSKMYEQADVVLDGGYITSETSAQYLKDILTSEGFVAVPSRRFASWHHRKG